MAEVRLKIGRRGYRLFLSVYKQSQVEIGGNQARNTIQTTRALVCRSGGAHNDYDVKPRLTSWTAQPALGICDDSFETENSRSFCTFTDVGYGSGRCCDLVSKCKEGELEFWSAWRKILPDSDHVRLHDKNSASSWFYGRSPNLTDSPVHVIASSAVGRRKSLVAGTTNPARCEHRRYLCSVRFANRQSSLSLQQSHGRLLVRAYGNGNLAEPLYKSRTAYYEILQVSPTATQAQIKTAYYKQSFIYHPDKNAGSTEATHRFSNISEAYNVLGNKGLRKKYDRGILSQGDVTGATKPSTKDSKSSSSQPTRESRQSTVLGIDNKKIFDFDNFIRSHYKSQLLKEEELRIRKEEMMRRKESMKDQEMGKMMEMAVGVLVILAVSIVISLKQGGN